MTRQEILERKQRKSRRGCSNINCNYCTEHCQCTIEFIVGDKIGIRTMEGLSLGEITGVYAPTDKDIRISYRIIYKPDLSKPLSREIRNLLLPQQRCEIRTKEEYFEEMQSEINKKQNILNELKEQYK